MDRKKRDLLLRKSDILRAAERIFAVKGYHRATMTDIAEEAQYAVGTLYLYFKDKQNLYLSLFEDKMKELLCLVREELKKNDGGIEKIKVLIKVQLEFFVSNENFFRIFFSVREGLQWKIKDRIPASSINLMLQLLDYTTEVVKQAQGKGIIRSNVEPKKAAILLRSLIHSAIFPLIFDKSQGREDTLDQDSFIIDAFLNGVGVKQ